MSRFGLVTEIHDDRAVLKAVRRGACAECSERTSCSFESALGKDTPEVIEALNPIAARPGDYVEFDLEGRLELRLSLLIWAVPIAGLVAGASLGHSYYLHFSHDRDLITFLGAVAGLAAALVPVIVIDRRVAGHKALMPVIKRRAKPEACPSELRAGDE